ncbi:MAG: GTPase Era [Vampirovibrionales bacterium]|nr:GTPase Era [Vampirovibrionales bacterium]
MAFKCGFVALVGRPNAGKSSLMNRLVGEPVAIATPVAQTTRYRIRGVLTTARAQVIFLDTPGFSKALDKLGEYLVQEANTGFEEADVLLWVVDATQAPGKGDIWMAERLVQTKKPFVLLLNHWDRIEQQRTIDRQQRREAYQKLVGEACASVLVSSAVTGRNLDAIVRTVTRLLPTGEALYPADTLSDQPMRMMAAELIREQAMVLTRDDLPHSVAVMIESFEPAKHPAEKTVIRALLVVDHPSRKKILIGEDGQMIKQIGMLARQTIEALVEGPVFLALHVKVHRHWRKDFNFVNNLIK